MITKLTNDIAEFVDWSAFNQNTSEAETTMEFANGEISFKKWKDFIWSKDAKSALKALERNFTPTQILRRAKLWCKKEGF